MLDDLIEALAILNKYTIHGVQDEPIVYAGADDTIYLRVPANAPTVEDHLRLQSLGFTLDLHRNEWLTTRFRGGVDPQSKRAESAHQVRRRLGWEELIRDEIDERMAGALDAMVE